MYCRASNTQASIRKKAYSPEPSLHAYLSKVMRASRKFCQRGFNFNNVFFRGDRMQTNTTIIGPSAAHKRNAIEMVFRWCTDDVPTVNAGLAALRFSGDPDQYC